jgi:hypothetical protein
MEPGYLLMPQPTSRTGSCCAAGDGFAADTFFSLAGRGGAVWVAGQRKTGTDSYVHGAGLAVWEEVWVGDIVDPSPLFAIVVFNVAVEGGESLAGAAFMVAAAASSLPMYPERNRPDPD